MEKFKMAMFFMIRVLFVSGILFLSLNAKSAPPDWIPVPNLQYNMNVIGKLQIDNGVFAMNPNDLVAAFVGDECRGVVSPLHDFGGLLFLTIGSNQLQGETITFKAYLADTGEIHNLDQNLVFENQLMIGTAGDPFIFGFPVSDQHLVLQNVFIWGGSSECFSATETITAAGDNTQFVVYEDANATLIAGERIRFYPGTHIQNGSTMHAYISNESCDEEPIIINDHPEEIAKQIPAIIKDHNHEVFFIVYPNPTSGRLTLELGNQDWPVLLEVYDMLQNRVYKESLSNKKKHEINLSNHHAGVYIIKLSTGRQTGVQKIIKR